MKGHRSTLAIMARLDQKQIVSSPQVTTLQMSIGQLNR